MSNRYAFLETEAFVKHLAEHFSTALAGLGYHTEIETGSMIGPDVTEFVRDANGERRVVTVAVDYSAGDPGEAELSVESELDDSVVDEVVAEGLFGLLAQASRGLIKSVDDAATRTQIVDRLNEVLAGLR